MYLVLIRHGETLYNREKRFCGWTNVDLSDKGIEDATKAGEILSSNGFANFDVVYTSLLKRSLETLNCMSKYISYGKMYSDYRLNERHYGALQGILHEDMVKKYGEEQVHTWRRSFSVRPPLLDRNDERNPEFDELYKDIPKEKLPLGESLEDTLLRVDDFYKNVILKNATNDQKILIVAHGNSLRALIKDIEKISDEDIVHVEIPTAKPIVYELNDKFELIDKKTL